MNRCEECTRSVLELVLFDLDPQPPSNPLQLQCRRIFCHGDPRRQDKQPAGMK